ncbi:hypothetical protein [Aristophania vespae]|uniref:hypothetical protein n=1 Tax=Aristophania vespae TaxID=2697033 RepID=UPI00235180E6|nr:hypothetical protein [Aristophania vespae]UMM63157.1 hypothetical protein DM15PD_01120 [Aristophania vespae]
MSLGGILNTAGRTVMELAYTASPILLTGGVAEKMGGTVPILLYTQAIALVNGLISGGLAGGLNIPTSASELWCNWYAGQGAEYINNKIAHYPFANQSVAANAVIRQPTQLTMRMECPARGPGAMVTKLATLQSLQAILAKHSAIGGQFVIITPGQIFTGMLLTGMTDNSQTQQSPASSFDFKFERPLTQISEGVQQQSTLMKKLSGGGSGITGWGNIGSGNPLEGLFGSIGII